ncbi:MAG: flagellar basal body-associated protein FliL [Bacillus sp. (in: firmicutes)]
MKKNKLLTIMVMLLVAITLAGAISLVMLMNTSDEAQGAKEVSAKELEKVSIDIPEITTNLEDDGFIKIAFTIQTNQKAAKGEIEKRNFQVQNIIITELSELKAEAFEGKKGIESLQEKLKSRINSIMQDGTVEKVYVTSSIIQ